MYGSAPTPPPDGSSFTIILGLVAFFFALLPYILLARISHWTHATQKKLEETNRHLATIAQR